MIPPSVLWRLSLASFGLLVVGALALVVAAANGQTGGNTIFDNLWLGVPGVVAFAGATVSMLTGIAAILRHDERSGLSYAVTMLSTLIFLWVVLELLFGG